MNESFKTIINNLKRGLSNEALSVKLYIVWGILTLVIFGVFGFYPVLKNFISNIKLVEEMYQNNLSLKNKIKELEVAKEKLELIGEDAHILDTYMPNDFEAQTYMVNLSMIASESGYTLDKMSFGKSDASGVLLTIGISGRGNLEDLIKKIEFSGRLMEIQNIRYSIGEKSDTVNMTVKSFIMER